MWWQKEVVILHQETSCGGGQNRNSSMSRLKVFEVSCRDINPGEVIREIFFFALLFIEG